MGLGTLFEKAVGAVIGPEWSNELQRAIKGAFVGRDETSGAATAGQSLGTPEVPWGTVYADSFVLSSGGGALDPSLIESQPFRIVSGKTRSGSNQPSFLLPSGSGLNFTIQGADTPLVLQIAGEAHTLSADLVSAGVAAASSGNTATLNDAAATGQSVTRVWGEYGSGSPYYALTVSAMGANLSLRVGTFQAFKVGTEYFVGFIESTTSISRCLRGYFFDSTSAPVKRAALTNGDTITLLNLGYVFLDSNGVTVDTIFTGAGVNSAPVIDATAPPAPLANDYWYDVANATWKKYTGGVWSTVSRHLIGVVACDSAACVAARSFDFYALNRQDNTVELVYSSGTVVLGSGPSQRVNVNGQRISFGPRRAVWDTATSLASAADRYNAAVQANATECFYVTDQGKELISDIEPYWRADLLGWYHPHNPWRYVGQIGTDGSAAFLQSALTSQPGTSHTPFASKDLPGDPRICAKTTLPSGYVSCDGTSYAVGAFPLLFAQIGYTWGGSGTSFKVPDWRGRTLIGDGTGAGLTARTLGTQNIGEESHTLTAAEIPAHTHDISHTHSYLVVNATQASAAGAGVNPYIGAGSTNTGGSSPSTSGTGSGGGGAHNTMQPSAVIKWMIKI